MTTVRGRFPARLLVAPTERGRFALTDPRTRASWVLGERELAVARLFTGAGTYEDVAEAVRREQTRAVSVASLRAFEARLLDLGVLDVARPSAARRVVRVLAAVDRVDLGAGDPTAVLDAVLLRTPWLARRPFAVVAGLGVFVAAVVLAGRFDRFAAAASAALTGWGLLGLLVVTALSSVFHEGGHALACRAYGVPVRHVGLGLRSLAVFAWTEPDQGRWDLLPWRRKLVTVAAGSFGSLVYAALGVLVWVSTSGDVGVWMVVAGTVCVVPTLLPSFDGDAYLLLTCLPGLGNLRSRSFAAVRGAVRGRWSPAAFGHVAFALATVLGRVVVAGTVLWLVVVFGFGFVWGG
ncbi:MAG: hypothetical protein HOV94_11500 [Saccharothrix sp.]|nr:hypothetical protein [Saccharothrix sp.]